jgi:two-component system sensor histidine kinase YesM
MKDFNLIQDMVRSLADYLRYMCRGNYLLVSLEEELKHIRNYLQIQKIRSGDNLICNIDADQQALEVLIPPLVLHTFIENIVKHALSFYEPITVTIKTVLFEKEEDKYVKIIIQDSGNGFKEEAIESINSDAMRKGNGESIGIWNVKQRLKLIYGGKASIVVSNTADSGACVELILPVEGK